MTCDNYGAMMLFVVAFWPLLLWSGSSATAFDNSRLQNIKRRRQSFESQPSAVEVNPGEIGILSCKIFDKNTDSLCVWQRDKFPIRVPQLGKYEWQGNPDNGDCSLRIVNADINYDDGEWTCQVTPSKFDVDDGLASKSAKFVVRNPPDDPRIYFEGRSLDLQRNLSVTANDEVTLRCESRGGNPPADLKWFIGDVEIPNQDGTIFQKNERQTDNPRKWNAVSVLQHGFKKDRNGHELKCLAVHNAYSRRSREESTVLDVMYPPTLKLEKSADQNEFEADVDTVEITCNADGNPKPDVVWRKSGGESIFTVGKTLKFEPVKRQDRGTYFCMARNSLGNSDELSVNFDVLYPPQNIRTEPGRIAEVKVPGGLRLECGADGYPPPTYQWLQKVLAKPGESGGGQEVYARGEGRTLTVDNATYEHEGLWACLAKNVIKGKEKFVQSETILVEVSGKPQFVSSMDSSAWFPRGTEAELKASYCSDPPPLRAEWKWNNLVLRQGQSKGRFSASEIKPIEDLQRDCYKSFLKVADLLPSDAGDFTLDVTNQEGQTTHRVRLNVSDPISMTSLISLVSAGLVALVILIVTAAFAYKKRVLCFKKATKGSSASGRNPKSAEGTEEIPSNHSFRTASPKTSTETLEAKGWIQHPSPNETAPVATLHQRQLRSPPNFYHNHRKSTKELMHSRNVVIPRIISKGKTPQNVDYSGSSQSSISNGGGGSDDVMSNSGPSPTTPVIMYADLQFDNLPKDTQQFKNSVARLESIQPAVQ